MHYVKNQSASFVRMPES